MIYGFIFYVARGAFSNANVVELVGFPTGGVVTFGAVTGKMFGWWCFVATFTFGGGIFVLVVAMTGLALNEFVAACEGVEVVVYVLVEEGDAHRANGGCPIVAGNLGDGGRVTG